MNESGGRAKKDKRWDGVKEWEGGREGQMEWNRRWGVNKSGGRAKGRDK